ncbi:MAG: hypothetical protein ACP5I4_02090 [Oceanipulchritudo sp.]
MLRSDASSTALVQSLFAGVSPVWAHGVDAGRNQFVSFQKEVTCMGSMQQCWLHLFADTRYRLYVNGQFLAYGPGRFVTQYPEFDSHELSGWFKPGRNRVRVEVNYYGASSYQSMPDGKPGFIAAGGTADGSVDFSTPGDWSCRVHRAWDAQAPLFSFAQNPAEICDTRVLERELEGPFNDGVRVLSGEEAPWGPLRRRSTGYPEYAPIRPALVSVAGPLVNGKRLLAIQTNDPEFPQTKRGKRYHQRILSWIYSPRAHDCELDCLWVDLELNGRPLKRRGSTPFGNHEVATLPLREGWNLLAARYSVLLEHWTVLFGYPAEEQISWHAHPDRSVEWPFLASSLESEPLELPAFHEPESFVAPEGWAAKCGHPDQATPARRIAWDEFNEARAVRNLPMSRFPEVSSITAQSASWCFHFGDEYYGHPVIEVEAPEGTILDIAYDDWQREDGATNLYSSNPFTDAADRFILRGGRQRIEVCNPRGGIFMQVTLRSQNEATGLRIADINVRSRRLLTDRDESFDCGDEVFNWAWERSLHTLVASTDEGYADCPWRERGSYIGDSYVNLHLHGLVTADWSIPRRVLRIFGEAQLENGQLAPVAPAWHRRPHEDFTLIWLQGLRDYWTMTGDASLLEEMWPHVERLWASPVWKEGPSGLWNAVQTHVFLDWGKLNSETEGEANAVLNLFRLEGARASAQIAGVLGKTAEVHAHAAEAERVRVALESTLWDEAQGRFLPSPDAMTPAVHANVLALRYGVGDADKLMKYLEPLLRENFRYGIENGQGSGYIELYFFIYLLPALAAHGRHDLAEALIREHYGFLKGLGYPTLNECFSRAHNHTGSCCHSWSGAAGVYIARYLLGLRQVEPGNPDRWEFDPAAVSIDRAKGSIPHSKGMIRIEWVRRDGRIRAHIEAPDGVEVRDGTC